MTTQQEIDAIIGKHEPDAIAFVDPSDGVQFRYLAPTIQDGDKLHTDETVRAMIAEALAEKAQEPVADVLAISGEGADFSSISRTTQFRDGTVSVGDKLYLAPPTTEAAEQAAAVKMREKAAEMFEEAAADYAEAGGPGWEDKVSRAMTCAESIRALPLETAALRSLLWELANTLDSASKNKSSPLTGDEVAEVIACVLKGDDPAALVDRILAGKGEVKS